MTSHALNATSSTTRTACAPGSPRRSAVHTFGHDRRAYGTRTRTTSGWLSVVDHSCRPRVPLRRHASRAPRRCPRRRPRCRPRPRPSCHRQSRQSPRRRRRRCRSWRHPTSSWPRLLWQSLPSRSRSPSRRSRSTRSAARAARGPSRGPTRSAAVTWPVTAAPAGTTSTPSTITARRSTPRTVSSTRLVSAACAVLSSIANVVPAGTVTSVNTGAGGALGAAGDALDARGPRWSRRRAGAAEGAAEGVPVVRRGRWPPAADAAAGAAAIDWCGRADRSGRRVAVTGAALSAGAPGRPWRWRGRRVSRTGGRRTRREQRR